jgi:hypothetical protein
MTTKPKARRARVVTEAEAAALNFEPWKGEINTELLHGLALMNSFEAAKNFFSRFSEFLDLAEARIIVAGSAYLQSADVADRLLRKIQRSHGRGA